MASPAIEVVLPVADGATRAVRVSSPDKTFFPTRGETKRDLVAFYEAVAEPLLAVMGGRPTMLQRFPDGAGGKSFFQKRVPKNPPDWLETTVVSTPNGTTSDALVVADIAHVVWAVNLGCLGFHPWPYLASSPEVADEVRIDLDPGPKASFDQVRAAAIEVRALLDDVGITGFVKTTGNRGLHVYATLEARWTSYDVRAAVVALARELERRRPDLLTAQWWKEERGDDLVFVDFNQNAPHKTVFGAWCVRPRVGGQVSTPLAWDEVATVEPEEPTLATVPAKLTAEGDPWATKGGDPQSIETLLGWFQRDIDDGLMDAPWPPVYPKQPLEPPRVAPSRARKDD